MRFLFLFIAFLFTENCFLRVDWDKILSPPQKELEHTEKHDGNLTKAEIEKDNTGSKNSDSTSSLSVQPSSVGNLSKKECSEKKDSCIKDCREKFPYSKDWITISGSVTQAKRNGCYDNCLDTLIVLCGTTRKEMPYGEYSP